MNHLRQLCQLVHEICLLSETSSDVVPFTLTHIQVIHSELVEGVQRHSAPRPLTSRVSALLTAVSCLSDCQRRRARTARRNLNGLNLSKDVELCEQINFNLS